MARPNFVLTGNPGTGKTSIAKIIANVMNKCDLVSSPDLVIIQRENLVGAHIGETAQKTTKVVKAAFGKTLLIDEAYRLVPNTSSNDFGVEAVETIMSYMEGDGVTKNNRPSFMFAGYPEQMKVFINANAGLRRRIQRFFSL